MWTHLRDWKKYTSEWIDGRFINIDTEVIRNKANLFSVVVNKASKKLVANPVLDELREAVFSFKETMPIVMALRNKYLKNYHWDKIKAFMN
jgi:dynein heavy chain